jgi:hypothetical protein
VAALGHGDDDVQRTAASALQELAMKGGTRGADILAATKGLLYGAVRLMNNPSAAGARDAAALVGFLVNNGTDATREKIIATAGSLEGLFSQLAATSEVYPHMPSIALVKISKGGAAACERLVAAAGCGAALVAALVVSGNPASSSQSGFGCEASIVTQLACNLASAEIRGRITAAEPGLLDALAALLHAEKIGEKEDFQGARGAARALSALAAATFEDGDAIARAPGCLAGLVRLLTLGDLSLFLPAVTALRYLSAAGASICERVFRTPGCLSALTARLEPGGDGAAVFMAIGVLEVLATSTGGCIRRRAAVDRDRRRDEIARSGAVPGLRALAATGDAMLAAAARGLLDRLSESPGAP